MSLEISGSEDKTDIDRDFLSRCGERLLAAGAGEGASVSLYLTDDDEIQRMNRRFRHVDRPTDVLSFASGSDDAAEGEMGDIVISVETAERQAREMGETLMERLVDLLAHGVLHLEGLDHDGGEGERWEREERKSASLVRDLKAEARGGGAGARKS